MRKIYQIKISRCFFIAFIAIIMSCEVTNTDGTDVVNIPETVFKEVDLRFHMILNGEKSRPSFNGPGVVLEMNNTIYQNWGNFGRFRITDIKKGEYQYTATYSVYKDSGTVFIDSSYVEIQFGDEFLFHPIAQIFEVSGSDTTIFTRGAVIDKHRANPVNNGFYQPTLVEKGEVLDLTINSPAFNPIEKKLSFNRVDSTYLIYIQPKEYLDIVGNVSFKNNSSIYPLSNAFVNISGNYYQTDENGDFKISSIQPGLQTLEVNEEGFFPLSREIQVNSSVTPHMVLNGSEADFLPLKIGNYWKYQVSGTFTDSGLPDRRIAYTSEWYLEDVQIDEQDTIYTIKEIKNGYETYNWASDTTRYYDHESEFQIIIDEAGKISFKNSDFNFANPYYHGSAPPIYRYNLSYFFNITIGRGYNFKPEEDIRYSSYNILTKGIGLTKYLNTSGSISTTSPYSLSYTLLEYNLVN
ncbi:MAG: hypothetical protein ACMZ7B_08930 [Balneola sp.]